MKNSFEILIKHSKNWGLDKGEVVRAAISALKKKGLNKDVELSIAFVGRTKAKRLNQEYRNMDYVPQVLGFPMSRKKDEDGKIRLGDIVICTQKLKYEARFQNKTVSEVLGDWLLHGVENLLK